MDWDVLFQRLGHMVAALELGLRKF
jgi:hypothetical protein